ncbi:MAG: SDR family oxidoreductase [Chloroflexi bacterium]|nr:SDR family oxidoreductase [Chloroflexota bacterium]
MDLRLKNIRALVTGSTRGLGYATARCLSFEGALVAINGRDDVRLQNVVRKLSSETGNPVYGLAGDVGDPTVPEKVIKAAYESMGGLDILICNAGGPPPGAFESFDETTWQRAIDLSFMSNVRLIKAALPFLRQSQAASVLTVTSYSVKQPIPNLVLSNSIRAATIGLTKSLALELGKDGIRFNSILPAWTETERVTELMTARSKNNGSTLQAEIDRQASESPLGRMSTPEEFANVATFLVSPLASYLTGVMLPVDGGMLKGTF